jgi:hypothetical protein
LISERKVTKPPTEYTGKKEIANFTVKNTFTFANPVLSFDAREDVIILVSLTNNT